MKAAILQPTYFPWMGYFGLIDVVDVFIFYDDTQFVRKSWQQRNRIKTPDGWTWLNVPVTKRAGQQINEARISDDDTWREKSLKGIARSYSKSPFFQQYLPLIEDLFAKRWTYLVDLNIAIIKQISDVLDLSTQFLLSSQLNTIGKKTDRLLQILEKVRANIYVSGPAAKNYIEINKFKEADIQLCWYQFKHPTYQQRFGEFIPYLSIIDLLFNVGDESSDVIRAGSENGLHKGY